MPLIVWDGSLDTGIAEIDAQHAYLFEIMNNLFDKLVKGRTRQAVRDVVDSMRNYARYHFETEERLMEQAGYVDLGKHKQSHARFVEELEKYAFLEDSDLQTLPNEALSFLINWVVWHIMTVDARYVETVKAASERA